MVLAYHVVFCAYGFWLPNDPRGSWSDFVGAWELHRFGPATKVAARRSVAGRAHDSAARLAAKQSLQHSPVKFGGKQALAVGQGFAAVVRKTGATVHACAILPEHVHLVVGRHRYEVEKLVRLLKGGATARLTAERLNPMSESERSPWARGQWCVYLNDDADIRRAIGYVEGNPLKEGKRPQSWSFVRPYGE